MATSTDHPAIRAYTCPQCGAPLASMLCAYCGSTLVRTDGDGLAAAWSRGAEAAARRRRDLGEPAALYVDDEEVRVGLYIGLDFAGRPQHKFLPRTPRPRPAGSLLSTLFGR